MLSGRQLDPRRRSLNPLPSPQTLGIQECVMSIDIVLNAPKTPARLTSIESMRLAMAGDREGWVDLFAEDGIVQDPYGPSPMDPTGKGRIGKAAIAKFSAIFINPDSIRFEIRQTITSGDACANIGTIIVKRPDGSIGWNEVINVYEVDAERKISLLRSYWDFDANMKTAF
jgi:steroid delta-isomerase